MLGMAVIKNFCYKFRLEEIACICKKKRLKGFEMSEKIIWWLLFYKWYDPTIGKNDIFVTNFAS